MRGRSLAAPSRRRKIRRPPPGAPARRSIVGSMLYLYVYLFLHRPGANFQNLLTFFQNIFPFWGHLRAKPAPCFPAAAAGRGLFFCRRRFGLSPRAKMCYTLLEKKTGRAGSDGGLSFTFQGETEALGEKLAAELRGGGLVAFTGGLGAGKTAFCAGIARGLGCTDPVSSPTFSIVNVYRGAGDLRPLRYVPHPVGGGPVRLLPSTTTSTPARRSRWSGARTSPTFSRSPTSGSRSKIWAATSEKLL